MKRYIVAIIINYILGIIIGLYKLSCIVLFLLIFLFVFMNLMPKARKIFIANKKQIIIMLIFLVLGVCHINFYNSYWEKINSNLDENKIVAEIVNLEKETNYQKTFKVKILNSKNKNKYILLKINKNQKIFNEIEIGYKIIFNGEIQEVEIQRNTGEFNYKEYLKSKNIFGIMKLKDGKVINKNLVSTYRVKNYLIKSAYNRLNKEEADFCLALAIGYKTNLSEEIKESFNKSNLSHMLAISGIHISYLMLLINFIIKPIKSKYKSIIIIFFLIFFMNLTGSAPSVERACLTLILNLIAPFVYRKSDTVNSLVFSAGIILFQNPFAIKDLGFVFSYTGTIGIMFLYPIIKEKIEIFLINKKITLLFSSIKNNILSIILNKILYYCKETIMVTISANILLLPLIIYNFNSISTLFIFSNVIVSPIIIICVILSFILIIINLFPIKIGIFISKIYSILIKQITLLSEFFSSIKFFNILICTPNMHCMLIIYFSIFIWLYLQKNETSKIILKQKIRRYLNLKNIICITLVIVLIFTFLKIKENDLKIYFIDVGQGDCTLIVTPHNKKILIDGGGVESDDYDVGKSVLEPYLLDRGIKILDYIMVSHFDSDHVKGLLYIMQNLKIKNAIISKQPESSKNFEEFQKITKEKKINVIEVNKGNKIYIENNVYFDILWPESSNFIKENILNNNSIVCKMNYNNFSILFTGDIEEIAEKEILKLYKNDLSILNSTILKVAHHGSKSSSIEEFVQVVLPKVALIGVGKNNRYGHPNEDVINKIKNIRSKNI